MNNISKSRSRLIHLYNPKKEGLGLYDVHYMNAHKKKEILRNTNEHTNKERYVA